MTRDRLRTDSVFLLVLVAAWFFALWLSISAIDAGAFDSIMSQDMAQIARNTLRGRLLQTNYVTPIGYAFFPDVYAHPDYLRYPFATLLYAALFTLFPASGWTIRLLNGFLFCLNGLLVARLAARLLRDRFRAELTPLRIEGLAWAVAIAASVLVFRYVKFAISTQTSEVLAITWLLGVLIAVVSRAHPALLGVLCAGLTMSRHNMAILLPLVGLVACFTPSSWKRRAAAAAWFAGAVLLVLSPYFIRNLHYTDSLVFSLQSPIHLHREATSDRNDIILSFQVRGGFAEVVREAGPAVREKATGNLSKALLYALDHSYWAAWIGCPLLFWLVPKSRAPLALLVGFVGLHLIALSFVAQIKRIYVPMYFALSALGTLGVAAAAIRAGLPFGTEQRGRRGLPVAAAALVVFAGLSLWVGRPLIAVSQRPELTPPSAAAVHALYANGVRCTYTNSPHWISWYSETIAVYAPVDFDTVRTQGPPECRYFMVDRRRSLTQSAQRFLEIRGEVADRGATHTLYRLRLD